MSYSSVFGLIASIGLFVGSILLSTDKLIIFWDVPSIILVFGGSLAACFMGFQARYVLVALKDIPALFGQDPIKRGMLPKEVGNILRWGMLVQKSGIIALEKEIKASDEYLLKYGIELVVTGYSGDEVRDLMSQSARAEHQRASVRIDILRQLAAAAPAFGMVGTLVGLVIMMQNLAGDPGAVGQGLALALLTTLYGVMVARLVFMPAANKLQQRSEIGLFRAYLITEGFAMLAEHRSPRYMQDKLNSYLDPSIHVSVEQVR